MFIQDLQESIRLAFVNWRNFSGRVSRKGFWLPVLALTVLSVFLNLGQMYALPPTFSAYFILAPIFAVSVPFCALMTRRLHDVNRRGWWMMFPLVTSIPIILIDQFPDFISTLPYLTIIESFAPLKMLAFSMSFVGLLFFIEFLSEKADKGVNKYGPPAQA